MKKIAARRLLDELETLSERMLEHVIQKWQLLPADKISRQPSPGAWSAGQCLAHLNSYGDFYLPVIEKAIVKARTTQVKANETFSPGWIGNYFTHTMRTNEKGYPSMKMKSPKNHAPANSVQANYNRGTAAANGENTDAVIAAFINQQEKFLMLIRQARSIDINAARVPVSIAPFLKLKLGDIFRILVAHNYRHIKQAERALGNSAPIFSMPAGQVI